MNLRLLRPISIRSLVSLLIGSSLTLISCGTGSGDGLSSDFQAGMKLLDQYDFVGATAHFDALAADNPESAEGPFGQALVWERQQLGLDALARYEEIAQKQPEFGPVFAAMGRAFTHLGEPEEAVAAFKRFAELSGDNSQAWVLYARSAVSAHRFNEAREAISHLPPGQVVDLLNARIKLATGDYDSIDDLVAATQSSELTLPAARESAELFESLGWADSAVSFCRKTVDLAPTKHDALICFFERTLRLGYLWENRQLLDRFNEMDTSGAVVAGLLSIHQRAANNSYAASQASAAFRRLYGDRYSAIVQDIHGRWMVGDAASVRADRDAINTLMKQASAPEAFYNFMIGRAILEFSGYSEVPQDLIYLRQSSGLKKGYPRYKLRLIQLLELSGQRDAADSVVLSIPKEVRSRPEWQAGLGGVYCEARINRESKAEELLGEALKSNARNLSAFENWVQLYINFKDWQKGVELFGRYPQFDGPFPGLLWMKAMCQAQAGSWDAALSTAVEASNLAGGNLQAVSEFLHLCRRYNEWTIAEKLIERLEQTRGDNPMLFELFAQHFAAHSDYKKTLEMADLGLALDSTNLGLRVQRGIALARTGNEEEGMAILEEARKSDFGDVRMLLPYSRLLAEDPKKIGLAANMGRQAMFFGGASIEPLLNLCEIYWMMERPKLTKGEARRAIGVDETDPRGHYWLGRAAVRLGEKELARDELNRAIELGLSGQELKQAQASLKRL